MAPVAESAQPRHFFQLHAVCISLLHHQRLHGTSTRRIPTEVAVSLGGRGYVGGDF